MNKPLLIPILLILLLLLTSCSTEKTVAVEKIVTDQGSIEVFFCPQDKCEEELISFLDSAEKSIHCALYDIGLQSVQEKLLEKQKEIEVQVVTDNDYLKKFDHPFVKADSYGLMHNKFCVVDGKKVSGGSMNPTENDAHKNNNNLLLIESTVIAQNYEDEFQEMWQGNFKKGARVKNPVIMLNDNGKNIHLETYFCPEDNCAERVRDELKKAEKSIHFMTFSFTHEGIANILLLKNLDGVEVKGVMEARGMSKDSQFERLNHNSVDVVKDSNKNNMHHKVFVIDEKIVVTGSFNPTGNGDHDNDENLVIIESEEIARLFLDGNPYLPV